MCRSIGIKEISVVVMRGSIGIKEISVVIMDGYTDTCMSFMYGRIFMLIFHQKHTYLHSYYMLIPTLYCIATTIPGGNITLRCLYPCSHLDHLTDNVAVKDHWPNDLAERLLTLLPFTNCLGREGESNRGRSGDNVTARPCCLHINNRGPK